MEGESFIYPTSVNEFLTKVFRKYKYIMGKYNRDIARELREEIIGKLTFNKIRACEELLNILQQSTSQTQLKLVYTVNGIRNSFVTKIGQSSDLPSVWKAPLGGLEFVVSLEIKPADKWGEDFYKIFEGTEWYSEDKRSCFLIGSVPLEKFDKIKTIKIKRS